MNRVFVATGPGYCQYRQFGKHLSRKRPAIGLDRTDQRANRVKFAVRMIWNDLSLRPEMSALKGATPTGADYRTYRLGYRRTSSGRRNNDVLNLSSNVLRLIPVRSAMLVSNAVHHDARATRRQRCNRRANHHRRRYANCDAHCHRIPIPTVIVIVIIVVIVIVVVMTIVMVAIIVVTVVMVIIATAAVVTASAVVTTTVVIAATVAATAAAVIAAAATAAAVTAVAATTVAATAAGMTTAAATTAAVTTTTATVTAMAHAAARMRTHLLATAWATGVKTTATPAAMKTASWRRVNTRTRTAAETKRMDTQRRRKKDTGNTGGRKLFCA